MSKHRWLISGILLLLLFISGNHFVTAQRNRAAEEMLKRLVEEEGLSPDEVRADPELQKKIREQIEQRREDPEFRAQVRDAVVEQKRREKQGLAGYDLIARNNLFKPLGSGDEKRGPAYALQITSIAPQNKHAIILEYAGNKLHDVKEGDRIGETVVELIEERHVRLKTPEGTEDLRLDDVQFIGGGGSRGGRRGGGPRGPSQKARPGGDKRAAAMAGPMRQRMQGRSPEEIERMMQRMREFRARRVDPGERPRGRRGGGRPQRLEIRMR